MKKTDRIKALKNYIIEWCGFGTNASIEIYENSENKHHYIVVATEHKTKINRYMVRNFSVDDFGIISDGSIIEYQII